MKRFYNTVDKISEGVFKDKGSKFIGFLYPCHSESDVKSIILDLKKNHHQARHFCYAYRFGFEGDIHRANDDGEPNNSAGIPILGQIQSFDLTNVLIVVVRYFGGTKLGVGGLVNAYKSVAKEAVLDNDILSREVKKEIALQFSYHDMPDVMHVVKKHKAEIVSQDFNLDCLLILKIALDEEQNLLNNLSNIKVLENKYI